MKMSEEFVALKKFRKKYLPMTFFIFGNGYLMIIKRTYDYQRIKDRREQYSVISKKKTFSNGLKFVVDNCHV